MTQQTINNYNDKQHEAERALTSAQRVIDNGDATTQEITSEKSKVEQAMQALTNAKSRLRADKNELQTAYNKLIENVSTNGKNRRVYVNTKQPKPEYKIKLMMLKMKRSEF